MSQLPPSDPKPHPAPLDYAKPRPKESSSASIWSAIAGFRPGPVSILTALYIWAFTLAILIPAVFVLPQLDKVYQDDFHGELPLTTRIMFGASRLIANDYLWLPILVIGLGLPFAINPVLSIGAPDAETFRRRDRWIRRLLFLVAMLLCLWIAYSSFSPYVDLINQLTNINGR